MEHIWACFAALSQTRPLGMGFGSIPYAEIEAFNRATLAGLTASDIRLIRQIDDQHVAIKTGVRAKPTNVASMKAALRGVIAERAARAKAKGAK